MCCCLFCCILRLWSRGDFFSFVFKLILCKFCSLNLLERSLWRRIIGDCDAGQIGEVFCFCFHIFAVAQLCFYRRLEPIITARYSNLTGPWPVLMPIRSSISTKTSLNTGEETFLFCARAKQFSVISRVFLGKHFGMLIICNYSKIPWPDDSLAMRHRSNGGIIRILICLVF